MEPKVNYIVVGAFVLLLGFTVLGAIFWLGKTDYRGIYDRYDVYTRESVAGLSVDSTVKYRGVDVGRVKEVVLNPENPEEVRITLNIVGGTPVKTDTQAVLVTQGLTGLVTLNLTGGTREAPPLSPATSLGGSNHEVCYGLAVSTSGYLLACGGTNSTNGQVTGKRGAYDGWVVSLDGNGNMQWSACMGGTMSESFSALTLNGNELLLAGYTSSNDGDVHGNHGSSDGWLVRDLNGNLIDSRCYGGSQGDALYAIALASNNQLLAAGGTLSTDGDIRRGMGLEDAWILRASRNLDLCWSMAAGGSAVERASSIAPTQDETISKILTFWPFTTPQR